MNGLKVFISHAKAQEQIAESLQSWHKELTGITAFLAKNSINGGEDFPLRIIDSIRSSDVFLCILSKEYKKSEYCDQELGIAIALDKMIIPIKYELNPYGFIDHANAIPYSDSDDSNIEILFYQIIGSVSKSESKRHSVVPKKKLANSLVMKLLSCKEYSAINKIATLLIPCIGALSQTQRSKIIKSYQTDYYISRAKNMKELMRILKKSD